MERLNKQLQISKEKLKSISFRKIAPNIVTMLALCAGVTSIRYSISAEWMKAVLCIFAAAFFDMKKSHPNGWDFLFNRGNYLRR